MRLLAFFVLLLSSVTLMSSNPPPSNDGTPPGATKYQVLYIKNVRHYVLLDHYDHVHHRHNRHRQINGGKKEMKNVNTAMKPDTWLHRWNTRRPFYVMLPKGFVPPSGSSPCHNLYTTSNHADQYFECRYVTKTLKP